MIDDSHRPPFVPDPTEESFRLMSGIMDLASSAGGCAEALARSGAGSVGIRASQAFVEAVVRLPALLTDVDGRRYDPDLATLADWRTRHSQAVEIARGLRQELEGHPGVLDDEPLDHVLRLGRRIADAEALMAARPNEKAPRHAG